MPNPNDPPRIVPARPAPTKKINIGPQDFTAVMFADHEAGVLRSLADKFRYLNREEYAAELDAMANAMAALRDRITEEAQARILLPGGLSAPAEIVGAGSGGG